MDSSTATARSAAMSQLLAPRYQQQLLLLLVLNLMPDSTAASCSCSCSSPSPSPRPESPRRRPPQGPESFAFYLHNQVYNPAVNNSVFDSVYSAGPFNFSGAGPNPTNFGVRSTFEDPIMAGPSRGSPPIGLAQGFWIFNSRQGYVLLHAFTATITSGPYTGTISILGQEDESLDTRTLSVIGGTGDFLAARGAAVSRRVAIDNAAPAHWTLSFDLDLYY